MRRHTIISLGIILISFACQDKEVKSTRNTFWESIYMNLDGNQELTILNYEDSAVFKKWADSLVLLTDGKKDWIRTKEKIVSFKITTVEKDSLFSWTNNLMRPVTPTMSCTDYVGHLIVRINYGTYSNRTTKSCEYSSICDWNLVSRDTKSIYSLLKIKKVDVE